MTDTWVQKAPMPTPRNALATCVVDGKIYAIGGESGVSGYPGLSTVERYDPLLDTWTTMNSSMPTPRRGLSTNVVNGIIYAIGGTVGTSGSSKKTAEAYNTVLDFPVNVKESLSLQNPTEFVMHQNYPNPFNPTTTIEFELPKTSQVTLNIYNILGEAVATLVSDRLTAGRYSYEWSRPAGMASGVYLYRLEADEFVEMRKMVLMR